MADRSVYVYAVGEVGLAFPEVTGVDERPVEVLVEAPLAAVVSAVDPVRFGEESLRHNLEDLQWLETTARAHHGVVAAVGSENLVAPLRMATIYVDESGVRTLLRERAAEFISALDRIRGRTEWGVKAFAVAGPAAQAEEPDDRADRPGTSYLLRRKAAREAATTGRQQAVDAAEDLHRTLAGHAAASRRYPPQDPRLTGYREEMVLNAAYLVEEAASAEFRELVEGWDATAVRLQLTGPWAPYSFATLEGP
jgi:Gas vesicle synthesis protein GvpL/GvpF